MFKWIKETHVTAKWQFYLARKFIKTKEETLKICKEKLGLIFNRFFGININGLEFS